MKRILLATILAAIGSTVEAGPLKRASAQSHSYVQGRTNSIGTAAHAKSQHQAQTGRMAHVGSVPPGHFEGVGFSTISPQDALDRCCYSRSGMPIVDQAVVRGVNGWYATRIYAAR